MTARPVTPLELATAMADDYPQDPEPAPNWWRRHGHVVSTGFAAGWVAALGFVAVFWRVR